ncbi:DUF262 domain-containing protein [Phnomibacter sp. MR]|uniref:DUF262 domain-containing protein n=1 Tax=Phnomibacter sp. MR TaxID=3042318 RepID=UPI003A7F7E9F
MSDKLVLKPINDLINQRFFIPSYQRGYRWKREQVLNLLDDIWSFRQRSEDESKEVFYCLQPVVVSKNENEWELIDGQQRITTILIILKCLKKQMMNALEKGMYQIRYETRLDSEKFLEELSEESLQYRNDNVDYFHICEAYDAVTEWFAAKDGIAKINFLTTLLNDNESGKNVKVIWYDVSDEKRDHRYAIDIFTRLNIGKIPLTNAELVKALFLMKKNFGTNATLKQLQIAGEWDIMEKKLQDDSFWYFIYSPQNIFKYENRIEYIFDLMQNKTKDQEEYYTFNKFLSQVEKGSGEGVVNVIDNIWLSIKQYFLSLEEWYSNRDLYHLIGFLIEYGGNINSLRQEATKRSKLEFVDYLKGLIKSQLAHVRLEDLDFQSDKKVIRKVLLLFNIQTILSTQKTEMRFPFNRYKKEKWDIEHVNSQTEKTVEFKKRKEWALDILEYLTGLSGFSNKIVDENDGKTEVDLQKEFAEKLPKDDVYKEICRKLIVILEDDKIDESFVEGLSGQLIKLFKESDIEDNNSISNLALLDESTNRSYGNAMFPIKRNRIIKNDMQGLFVPICTKNLFLKYYSKQMKDAMYWHQNDADCYLQAMKMVLKDYLSVNTK